MLRVIIMNTKLIKFQVLIISLLILSQSIYSQDLTDEKSSPIGITFGLDYNSNYIWRGSYFYNKDGVFFPSVSYDILKTGLSATIMGEIAESYIIDGKDGANSTAYANQGVDFGLDYSYLIADTVNLGLGLWYYYYFLSEDETGTDSSFLTVMVSASMDKILLNPTLSFTYDYYVDENIGDSNNQDFYIQLGIGHSFELTKEAALDCGLNAGFYQTRLSGTKSGISDIQASIGLSVEIGSVSLSGSFNYIITPTKKFYGDADRNRFYSTFSTSYSL